MQTTYPYNIGPRNVTIYGPAGPVSGTRTPSVLDAIRAGDFDEAIRQLLPIQTVANAFTQFGDVVVDGSRVLFKGRQVNNASAQRILELAGVGLPVESEARCLASLMRHDDPRVIELFEDFLERWNIPRTSDGRIVLCKGVRDDYKAIHDSKTDWSVGATVRMAWADVDRDPSNSCSRGLHAAPLEGARSYAGGGKRLIELYVWPEHIAALPYDYATHGKVRLVEAFVARDIPEEIATNYYDLTGPLIDMGEDESDAFNPRDAFDDGDDDAELSEYATSPDPQQNTMLLSEGLTMMTRRGAQQFIEECETEENTNLLFRAHNKGVRFYEQTNGSLVAYARQGGHCTAVSADALAAYLREFGGDYR